MQHTHTPHTHVNTQHTSTFTDEQNDLHALVNGAEQTFAPLGLAVCLPATAGRPGGFGENLRGGHVVPNLLNCSSTLNSVAAF